MRQRSPVMDEDPAGPAARPALATRGAFPAPGRPAVPRAVAHRDPERPARPGSRVAGPRALQPTVRQPQRRSGPYDWLLSDVTTDFAAGKDPAFAPAGASTGLAGRLTPEWSASRTSRRLFVRRAHARAKAGAGGGVMVRRALLDRGDDLAADPEAPFRGHAPSHSDSLSRRQAPPDSRPVSAGQLTSHWRGAGGRWLVWVGRVVVWAVIVLIGYRGVLAIVSGPSSPGEPATPRAAAGASSPFPVAVAEAYALEFGNVYLNFSPATAGARSKALAAFLPAGADPQLGWNGAGTQQLLDEQVAGITVRSPHTALVTLLARLANGSLIELGVPVYASGGSMAVSGDPALLPGPVTAIVPTTGQAAADQATEATLQSQLAGFFAAYASGDQATLARFLTPGTHLTGLGGEVSLAAIDAVHAPVGGSTRTISVTVTWQFPARPAGRRAGASGSASAAVQMTYELTVVRRGGTWDVQSIGASAQAAAQGPP